MDRGGVQDVRVPRLRAGGQLGSRAAIRAGTSQFAIISTVDRQKRSPSTSRFKWAYIAALDRRVFSNGWDSVSFSGHRRVVRTLRRARDRPRARLARDPALHGRDGLARRHRPPSTQAQARASWVPRSSRNGYLPEVFGQLTPRGTPLFAIAFTFLCGLVLFLPFSRVAAARRLFVHSSGDRVAIVGYAGSPQTPGSRAAAPVPSCRQHRSRAPAAFSRRRARDPALHGLGCGLEADGGDL